MDINFLNKTPSDISHYLIFISDGKTILNQNLNEDLKSFLTSVLKTIDLKKKNFDEDFTFYDSKNTLKRVNICKLSDHKNINDYAYMSGTKLSSFEKTDKSTVFVMIEENQKLYHKSSEISAQIAIGFYLKNYSFDKYKTLKSKKRNLVSKIYFCLAKYTEAKKLFDEHKALAKGVFFTRDLVSEPANILYPEKFVECCNIFKKVGL